MHEGVLNDIRHGAYLYCSLKVLESLQLLLDVIILADSSSQATQLLRPGASLNAYTSNKERSLSTCHNSLSGTSMALALHTWLCDGNEEKLRVMTCTLF